MVSVGSSCKLHHPLSGTLTFQGVSHTSMLERRHISLCRAKINVHFVSAVHQRKPPKYLRYPRRTKLPPDSGIYTFIKQGNEPKDHTKLDTEVNKGFDDPVNGTTSNADSDDVYEGEDELDVWEADQIEAISSMFQGRVPQKPGKLTRKRPLPLPLPYKVRPMGLPTEKRHIRTSYAPAICSQLSLWKIYKDPVFLLNLARKIKSLPSEENASTVLEKWGKFLRKGSLSLTIRELGHSGLPERALQTFCWAQKQSHLFPDDRILAATVEILARTHELKLPVDLEQFISLSSRDVLEAITRGFIKGGSLNLAWKLLSAARVGKRMLDSSVYAKLILELGKNPDKDDYVINLLEELGERNNLNLSLQDCTAIMKICVRLQKFEFVECLFDWFQQSENQPSVVMYTTVIHSRFSANRYREALALVWEMESIDCLFDLPAYRVVIKLLVALNDLPRAVRYFAKLKEAGFTPTYDLYRDMLHLYLISGRLAKCRELCKEMELAGLQLDAHLRSQLLQLEKSTRSDV